MLRRSALCAAALSALNLCLAQRSFSGTVSEVYATQSEQVLLDYTISSANTQAYVSYMWMTGDACAGSVVVRVYVDGEQDASVVYQPAKASGVGIVNATAPEGDVPPWGTKWLGSLGRYSYYHTLRIPFQASVYVTYTAAPGTDACFFFATAKGVEGLALDGIVPGFTLPPSARLQLQTAENVLYQPLDYMVLADVQPQSSGLLFLSSLWWNSSSPNTIEGCMRAYTPAPGAGSNATGWPGLLLSSGFEDAYRSSWGFIAGPFTTDESGITYWTSPSNTAVSVYRVFGSDPLFFTNGLQLLLRNGETRDSYGRKCTLQSGGQPVGSPGTTLLSYYAWYYTW